MRRLLLPFNPRILLRGSPSFSSSIQQPYPVSFSPVGFETGSLFFRNSSTKRKVKGLNRLDLKFEGEKSILVSQLNYPPHWGSWVPPSSLPPPPPSPPEDVEKKDDFQVEWKKGRAFLGEDEVEDLLGDEHDFQGLDFQIINEELGEEPKKGTRKYLRSEHRWFSDRRIVRVFGGRGGDGCVSFNRGRYRRSGPADGGDGGRGGDVIVSVNPNLQANLRCLKISSFRAPGGESGASERQRGRNGSDVVIEVPPGTIVTKIKDIPREPDRYEALLAKLEKIPEEHFDFGSWEESNEEIGTSQEIKRETSKEDEGFEERREILEKMLRGETEDSPQSPSDDSPQSLSGGSPQSLSDDQEAKIETHFPEKSRKILQQTSFTTRYLKDKEPEALNALEGRVKNSLRRVREQTKNDPELFQHYLRRIQRREERKMYRNEQISQKTERRRLRAQRLEEEERVILERRSTNSLQWALPFPDELSTNQSGVSSWDPFQDEIGAQKAAKPPPMWGGREGPEQLDLMKAGERYVIARGGEGGFGNAVCTAPHRRSPKVSSTGKDGEEYQIQLELKLIAQVGLVGFPNAGKSSFLRSISRATPKVAPYPFTTLRPHLGMVEFEDYTQISVADLPGLTTGAHENRGLGFEFLRHIERTNLLCYVIDVSREDCFDTFRELRYELEMYEKKLLEKPSIILANKMDEDSAQRFLPTFHDEVRNHLAKKGEEIAMFPVAAVTGQGVASAVYALRSHFDASN